MSVADAEKVPTGVWVRSWTLAITLLDPAEK
jgi:hypothetical protein